MITKTKEEKNALINTKLKKDDKSKSFVMADNFMDELKQFIKLFIPICIANLMEFLPQYAAFFFVGHLSPTINKQLLAAVGLFICPFLNLPQPHCPHNFIISKVYREHSPMYAL